MFSARTPEDLSENRLARALARIRAEGIPFFDLTVSNPTTAGFTYPPNYLDALARADAAVYEPHPFGLPAARSAVARDYVRHGLDVDPSRIVLTSSTSEAYSLLFKLLCDPGDEVLVPRPSYPLFDHLIRLDGCLAVPYALQYDGRWVMDTRSVDDAISSRTRAVLAVSPNNPTGSMLTRPELDALVHRCRRNDIALIVDEVFADYVLDGVTDRAMAADAGGGALVFSLGGLSKTAGLPHVKLSWIAASGPGTLLEPALRRLEMICDTYLSVSTPVQRAAGSLLAHARPVREQIHARLQRNLTALRARIQGAPACTVLRAEGGWYAVIRVPATRPEEELVLGLLTDDRVLVHPGYFFDFPHEAFLIVSLLSEPTSFDEAMDRIIRKLRADH